MDSYKKALLHLLDRVISQASGENDPVHVPPFLEYAIQTRDTLLSGNGDISNAYVYSELSSLVRMVLREASMRNPFIPAYFEDALLICYRLRVSPKEVAEWFCNESNRIRSGQPARRMWGELLGRAILLVGTKYVGQTALNRT